MAGTVWFKVMCEVCQSTVYAPVSQAYGFMTDHTEGRGCRGAGR